MGKNRPQPLYKGGTYVCSFQRMRNIGGMERTTYPPLQASVTAKSGGTLTLAKLEEIFEKLKSGKKQ